MMAIMMALMKAMTTVMVVELMVEDDAVVVNDADASDAMKLMWAIGVMMKCTREGFSAELAAHFWCVSDEYDRALLRAPIVLGRF